MKRFSCLVCVLCLLLSGCTFVGERIKEPITFYYVNDNYQKDMEQVIISEEREAAGHIGDISYLLALYSMGPATEDLSYPLPRNTRILLTAREGGSVTLNLSDHAATITDAQFTLASACIALTCMELTDVQQVSIVCADKDITIRKDNLLLFSSMVQEPQEETK